MDPQQWDDKNGKVLRAHPLPAQMNTLIHYESLILRLTQFAQHRGVPHWIWSDINLNWYGDFWQFLHQSFGIQKTGGFANHIKFLKKFMTLAKGKSSIKTRSTTSRRLKYPLPIHQKRQLQYRSNL